MLFIVEMSNTRGSVPLADVGGKPGVGAVLAVPAASSVIRSAEK